VRSKAKPATVVAALLIAAFVVFVVNTNRGIAPYSFGNVATFLVVGLSLGGIYAISACGLVVTYSTTGIFNFAHGAIGCFLAFVYWELRVNRHWPTPLALLVVIFVFAPVIGVVLDRLLIGLMLAIMGVTLTIWKPDVPRALPHFFEGSAGIKVGDVTATWHRIITLGVALAIAAGLRFLLYRTRLGVAMRAVVDNRPLAGLTGARPGVISGAAWALGSMTAAIAGILIAPETGMVVEALTLVVLTAFAAAAIAQLTSVPRAFVGGIIVGLATAFAGEFLSFKKDWSYAPDAIPAVILLGALLFLPQAHLETGHLKLTRRMERLTKPWEALLGAAAMVGIVVAWANGWIPWFTGTHFGQRTAVWLGRGADFMVIALIMLSLVPLIGWAGQISFANFAIAGFGAAMYAHVGGQRGDPLGVLWVVLMCAPLGVAVALPALRLTGLYLALATLAFAQLADKLLFRHPSVISQVATGNLYKPLHFLGFHISNDAANRKAFLVFVTVAFGVLFFAIEMLRRSRWARRWIAMADSPAASATIGVNLTASKVAVWALSGALAGFAGTLLGLDYGALRVDSFPLLAGLPLVLLLAANGVRYPVSAFLGAIGLAVFPALYEASHHAAFLSSIELIGPGLAAISMAYRPEGAVFYAGRDLAGFLPWRRDAREEKARLQAKRRDEDVRRDEVSELGLSRPFTIDKVAQLDSVLGVTDELSPGAADGRATSKVLHGAAVD
jgi:branched-chain amino acid transport system permease protein